MDEKNLDLNAGEETIETPAGSGQPEKKTTPQTESELEIKDEDIKPDSEDDVEDTVTLSKDKFQKLVEAKENYKKGLLSYKEKLKTKPKEEKGDYLSKQDFFKANEKTAIDKFVKDNPEMTDKWTEFVKHYSGKRGKDTVDGIVQDLDDAKTLFVKYNPPKEKGSEDKAAKAELSKESTLPSHIGPDGKKPKEGGIIPKRTPPTEWYKEE